MRSVGQAALRRQAYNGLANISKMTWSTRKAKHTFRLRKLIQLLMLDTGNDVVKYPANLCFRNLWKQDQQKFDSPKSDTSPARFFAFQAEDNNWALPREGFHFWTEKPTTPDFSKLGKTKANSPGETARLDNKLCLFCWHLRNVAKDCPKSTSASSKLEHQRLIRRSPHPPIRLEKRLSSPRDSAQPEDCIKLLVRKPSLLTHLLFQTLTHSHLFDIWHPSEYGPEVPRGSGFLTPSLTLYSFRLSTFLHMAFCLSNFDSLMDLQFCHLGRSWTWKSTSTGNPRTWLFMSLRWTRVARLY